MKLNWQTWIRFVVFELDIRYFSVVVKYVCRLAESCKNTSSGPVKFCELSIEERWRYLFPGLVKVWTYSRSLTSVFCRVFVKMYSETVSSSRSPGSNSPPCSFQWHVTSTIVSITHYIWILTDLSCLTNVQVPVNSSLFHPHKVCSVVVITSKVDKRFEWKYISWK